MARYVVAVSGGVDSVVLLHQLVVAAEHELVVAHFDHGIRDDSACDARFVAGLADKYGLQFETKREQLGASASEALARERRYGFLRAVAARHQAVIVTAHHADDVLGTIAINMIRGTGWRGLAPFSAGDVERPLLGRTKSELYQYAIDCGLEYVEDSTNQTDLYLRNRLRASLASLSGDARRQLLDLYASQRQLRYAIEQEIRQLNQQLGQSLTRSLLRDCPDPVAAELLRDFVARQSGWSLTWDAIERALYEIRTARPGTEHQLGQKVSIWLKRDEIIVGRTRPMV